MMLRSSTLAWAQAVQVVGWVIGALSLPALIGGIALVLVNLGGDETELAVGIGLIVGIPAFFVLMIGAGAVLLVRRGVRRGATGPLLGAAALFIAVVLAQLALVTSLGRLGFGMLGAPSILVLAVPGVGLLVAALQDRRSPGPRPPLG